MPDMHIYRLLKHAREKEKNTPVPDMHIYRLLKHAREKEKNTPVPDMRINVAEMCNRKGKKDHINARNVLKCCRNVQAKKKEHINARNPHSSVCSCHNSNFPTGTIK